ncbi:hypothetical protein KJ673_04145 [Patescibacteria group bacterium]|nr:hypothetical protein [Patescibacteria group bacterium]MBU4452831.1 hypothetical protein [Patescibacteria group bacterium]MCG2687214.1 hypothetical protein [Candidatus Parcubacteria bacterium]
MTSEEQSFEELMTEYGYNVEFSQEEIPKDEDGWSLLYAKERELRSKLRYALMNCSLNSSPEEIANAIKESNVTNDLKEWASIHRKTRAMLYASKKPFNLMSNSTQLLLASDLL